jgi:hypothetical protein
MAINVFLQSVKGEKCNEVIDLYYLLAKVWPIDDPSFPLLQYIDPYGDVTFNRAPMSQVERELQLLLERAETGEQKALLAQIGDRAERCHGELHIFLRFAGD